MIFFFSITVKLQFGDAVPPSRQQRAGAAQRVSASARVQVQDHWQEQSVGSWML